MRSLCNVVHLLNSTQYHCLNNNCYNVNSVLCEYLGQHKGAQELKKREGEISHTSLTNTAIIGGTTLGVMYGLMIGGPVGIGLWSLANSAVLLRNWRTPNKLQAA